MHGPKTEPSPPVAESDCAVGLLSSCLIADQLANSAAADTESQGVLQVPCLQGQPNRKQLVKDVQH